MFATMQFRDVFAEVQAGIAPGLYNTGSTLGTAVQYGSIRKYVYHLMIGSGSANNTIALLLFAGSTSTPTTLVGSTSLMVGSLNSGNVAVIDTRAEFIANSSLGMWIQPAISLSGGSINACVICHGYSLEYEKKGIFDTASYVTQEVDLY